MYTPIRSSRLYEQIVAQIQDRIVQGELQSGDKLPSERELTEQFGVSRTAVREAVKVLHEKGLVEIRPGSGTFVASVADSTTGVVRDSLGLMMETRLDKGLLHLMQVRSILEPEIAAIAAAMVTEDDLPPMKRKVEIMDVAIDDADTFIEADLAFHLALARATQNPLFPILIDPIIDLLREQRRRMILNRKNAVRGQIYHKQILAAMIKRDPDAARKAMTAHMEQVAADSESLSAFFG